MEYIQVEGWVWCPEEEEIVHEENREPCWLGHTPIYREKQCCRRLIVVKGVNWQCDKDEGHSGVHCVDTRNFGIWWRDSAE